MVVLQNAPFIFILYIFISKKHNKMTKQDRFVLEITFAVIFFGILVNSSN